MERKLIQFVPGTVIINALLVKLGMADKENTVEKLDKLKRLQIDLISILINKENVMKLGFIGCGNMGEAIF